MAVVTGVSGDIAFGAEYVSSTAHITKWIADIQRDIHDVTPFDAGANNARDKIGGMYHLVGTAEGWCDSDAMPDIASLQGLNDTGTSGADLILVGTTIRYQFTVLLSNVHVEVDKTGLAIVTFSFESSGVVTAETA